MIRLYYLDNGPKMVNEITKFGGHETIVDYVIVGVEVKVLWRATNGLWSVSKHDAHASGQYLERSVDYDQARAVFGRDS